ncbi:MAG: DUF2281 domain-containing protein [Methylovulum sp.]|nr:DUF2281 domain-containing protein [Methylovulum sp.]
MLQEQLIEEIKQLPEAKLAEIYDFIHYLRLNLHQKKQGGGIKRRPIGLAKGMFEIPANFFEPLPNEILDTFEGME